MSRKSDPRQASLLFDPAPRPETAPVATPAGTGDVHGEGIPVVRRAVEAAVEAAATERVERWATISDDGRYRYDLGERWDADGWMLGGLLLNPSTATADEDDATKRRWRERAQRMGAGGWVIVNPSAYRARFPEDLLHAARTGVDVVGPRCDEHIMKWAPHCRTFVVGFGAKGRHKLLVDRVRSAVAMLRAAGVRLCAIRTLSDGTPEHPLYLPYELEPVPWEPVDGLWATSSVSDGKPESTGPRNEQ